jgi:hypothetical protein
MSGLRARAPGRYTRAPRVRSRDVGKLSRSGSSTVLKKTSGDVEKNPHESDRRQRLRRAELAHQITGEALGQCAYRTHAG